MQTYGARHTATHTLPHPHDGRHRCDRPAAGRHPHLSDRLWPQEVSCI